MTSIRVGADTLIIEPRGLDKIWSFTRKIEIPLSHIRGATYDPGAIGEPKGLRAPGLAIGDKFSGTFYRDGERHFWNVRGGGDIVVIEVHSERFTRLFLSVSDPQGVVDRINAAI